MKGIYKRIHMKKHAYLVMAHNEPELLKRLILALDDERADIYLHLDRKWKEAPIHQLKNICNCSKLIILPRKNISWGGWSLVECELNLLKESTKGFYQYYHLISGVDFPLKTQDEINLFFDMHYGQEFFGFDSQQDSYAINGRVKEYHFFQDFIGRNNSKKITIRTIKRLEHISLQLQKKLNINRINNIPFQIYKGGQWFDITHNFARYVLSKEKVIKKYFRWSCCADELVLQSIAMQSEFARNLSYTDMREIDWEKGSPYVYSDEDYDFIISSSKLFARKFSYYESQKLINSLLQRIVTTSNCSFDSN